VAGHQNHGGAAGPARCYCPTGFALAAVAESSGAVVASRHPRPVAAVDADAAAAASPLAVVPTSGTRAVPTGVLGPPGPWHFLARR